MPLPILDRKYSTDILQREEQNKTARQLVIQLRLIGHSCVIISEQRLAHFSQISRD